MAIPAVILLCLYNLILFDAVICVYFVLRLEVFNALFSCRSEP